MSTKWIGLWKIYSITCTHILKLLHTCYFYQSLHTFASLIVLNTASKKRLINWVQSQTVFIHYSKISYCEMPLLLVKLKNMKNNVRFSPSEIFIRNPFLILVIPMIVWVKKSLRDDRNFGLPPFIALNCTSWTVCVFLLQIVKKWWKW